MDDASTPAVLRALRVTLHVSFAGLLMLGLLRLVLGAHTARPVTGAVLPVLCLGLSLAGVYLAGTLWESRFAQGRTSRDPRPLARPWLGLVTVLWSLLTLYSPDFSWVVFPLFFVYLVMLSRIAALLSIAVLTTVVVLAQHLHAAPGAFTPAMVAGPVIGAVSAVVVGHAYRALYRDAEHHRRTVRALEAARSELSRQEREAGRAGERERLSREIHDTLAQGLSSIVLMSRAAGHSLERQDAPLTQERLGVIEATAAENLAEARRFVRDLSSPALDSDLTAALQELCAHTAERARAAGQELQCRFRREGRIPDVPRAQRTVLLRAAQSSLANVVAHSRARTAVVTLAGWADAVSLDVFDDGDGFSPASLPRADDDHGFGLAKLRARVQELEGTLTVESGPGAGTVVGVRLPLAPVSARDTASAAGRALRGQR
ncbi:sensor histidine kinase [Kocuria rosea]|uniref:sensor histidine kinase n=1 Tax=Kocuria rosea TaxID=1275 RepID=UPI00253FECEF|nr:sensor histidine kinase [Kocuria rosea]WIG17783.1 sensor histidine kinase [Kocuria rosea]